MKLKIFLLVASLAVLSESVSVNPPIPRNSKLNEINLRRSLDEFKTRKNFDKFSPPFNFNKVGKFEDKSVDSSPTSYRLPNASIPLRYDLWLKTDVDKKNLDFSGRVKIHIRFTQPTENVTLHYRQITVDKADLLNTDQSLNRSGLDCNYYLPHEFLVVTLPRMMAIDDEIILDISYHGILRDDASGFYRASYEDETTNEDVWLATTQFEQTDARHAMPCYDEPGIRAVIGLEIQHDKSYNAISNMPISTREPIVGTDYVTTKFQDTPPMQSYLLAFVISDFKFISNNEVNVEQRIYAKPQSIDRGDGDFAAGVVGPILRKFEEHFEMLYPLPKMDHAAITDYIWGAMENFGLITYAEYNLLYDQTELSRFTEKSIIEIIAHEYAHQYFGNIVAPKWWSYTWLNEGFATLYQFYLPSLLYPEEDFMERFQRFTVRMAYALDQEAYDAPALSRYVETQNDIRNKFDSISYQKGGSFLRMFQEALTVPTFTKGLKYYLNEMFYSAATPEDLHDALQRAYDEDFPGNGINLDRVMKTWEDQAGYPIVHVEKSGGKFVMTQQRFGGGKEIYSIPISFTTSSRANFEQSSAELWMTNASAEHKSDDEWIILNIQNTGYYKVSYGKSIINAIIDQLQSNHEIISPTHRSQFIIDMSIDIMNELIEPFYGLELLSYLKNESSSSVWEDANIILDIFVSRLFGTDVRSTYFKFSQSLAQPHIDRLGFEPVEGETSADANLRSVVKAFSCESFNDECLKYELNRLTAFIENGESSYDFCHGLRLADEATFSIMITKYLNAKGWQERSNFARSLSCSLDANLIKRFLELVLDETNNLFEYERNEVIGTAMSKSVTSLEVWLEFVRDNFMEIERIMPGVLRIHLYYDVKEFINTAELLRKFTEVLDLMLAAGHFSELEVLDIAQTTERNMKWIERNLEDIEKWLGFDGEETTTSTSTTSSATDSTESQLTTDSTTSSSTTLSSSTTSDSSDDASTTLGSNAVIASLIITVVCTTASVFTPSGGRFSMSF